jgi:hypothetical protein
MAFHKVPFKFYTGETFNRSFIWSTGNSADTALPVNLTGCTAKLQIRPTAESSEVLLELSTQNSGITLGGITGQIRVYVTDEQTAAFTWIQGVYDLFIYFPDGSSVVRLGGLVSVGKGVTRA